MCILKISASRLPQRIRENASKGEIETSEKTKWAVGGNKLESATALRCKLNKKWFLETVTFVL